MYIMLQNEGYLSCIWHDVDFMLAQLSPKAVFGTEEPPSTWPQYLNCLQSSMSRVQSGCYLEPSQLMTMVHTHLASGTRDSLKPLELAILDQLKSIRKEDTSKATVSLKPNS
jgi:hypothetical protein